MRWTYGDVGGIHADELRKSTRSLTQQEVGVHFQPIADLWTGKVFAQEALCRCTRPGFERPDYLFAAAVAEQATGHLGRLVREAALPFGESRRVFINLHPAELSSRWLVRPDDPIYLYSGPLYLEITEAAALEYFDLCKGVLAEVCSRTGAVVVVDDFGAGYSNLTRIIELKPGVVKLDRTLVRELDKNARQRILVANINRLCQDLGADVVAEGIETQDELQAVIDCGVRYGQGYLLGRPSNPPPEVTWRPQA